MAASGDEPTPLRWLRLRLAEKGIRYWITAAVILLAAFYASPALYDAFNLTEKRSYYFQRLLDWGPRPAEPKFVKLVLIDDDEYWSGMPAGRAPINRDYLAQLVDKLVEANAHVIALDFDVRLPDPKSMQIPPEYKDETCRLIASIKKAVEKQKKLVLATPIAFANGYIRQPDIYQANGLCASPAAPDHAACGIRFEPSEKSNVSCGHISLPPHDQLTIPLQLSMLDGGKLDAFALALARAKQPELVDRLLKRMGERAYANFIPEQEFRKFNSWLSARDLLRASDVTNQQTLQGSAVIIGANWHSYAAGRGPRADLQETPVGRIVGALLLANFAEAILDRRVFSAPSKYFIDGVEILFGVLAVVILALLRSFGTQLIALLCLVLGALAIQALVLYFRGMFFDVFLPLLGVAVHAFGDRFIMSFETEQARRGRQAD